jgi:hypothetical protein
MFTPPTGYFAAMRVQAPNNTPTGAQTTHRPLGTGRQRRFSRVPRERNATSSSFLQCDTHLYLLFLWINRNLRVFGFCLVSRPHNYVNQSVVTKVIE